MNRITKLDLKKEYNQWFDSPFYHILYKNRDYNEAEKFIKNILKYLKLKKGSCILDAACGKGRHSIIIEKLGYNVLGIDLSKNSSEKIIEVLTALEELDDVQNIFTNANLTNLQ